MEIGDKIVVDDIISNFDECQGVIIECPIDFESLYKVEFKDGSIAYFEGKYLCEV